MLKWRNKLFRCNRQLETDLYIKPSDTHHFLDSTSCHRYRCKKSNPIVRPWDIYRICSDNEKFDSHCNNLVKWLIEKEYSERMVKTRIFKAKGESRDSLLERVNTNTSKNKLTFESILECLMHIARTSKFFSTQQRA